MTLELGQIMGGWAVLTTFLSAGSAYGAIKITQKYFLNELKELKQDRKDKWNKLDMRMSQNDRDFVTEKACIAIRQDHEKYAALESGVTCGKLDKISRDQEALRQELQKYQLKLGAALARIENIAISSRTESVPWREKDVE